MTRLTPEQKEIIAFLMAAADGETTAEQRARAELLITQSEDMQLFTLRLLHQESWLSLHGLHEPATEARAELAAKIGGLLTAEETFSVSQALAEQYSIEELSAKEPHGSWRQRTLGADSRRQNIRSRHALAFGWISVGCAALLFGLGIAVGTWLNGSAKVHDPSALVVENTPMNGQGFQDEAIAPDCRARLLQFTSCVWGQEMRPRINDSVRSGDALNLIHGLAELEVGWQTGGKARVRLEGPSGMVLMSHGGVNLNHGKLTASVTSGGDGFAIETPLARIEVADDSTVGVVVSQNWVEFHVLRGEAKVVTDWTTDSETATAFDMEEGQSIQFAATDLGTLKAVRDIAAPGIFVSQIPMADDLLSISDEYVDSIKQASPICYWRFNQPVDGLIHNEMADRYHGKVLGNIEWVREADNWTIRCGNWLATDMPPSHVVADRPMESTGTRSYSLEVWVKPSHAHLASIASLLSLASDNSGSHGMLLELGGPSTIFTGREHPGRVRFLHRNPPNDWGGNSCFSNLPYGLRKWQHIVAVKDNSAMALYIDGEQVGKCEDTTPLPDGLLLLVGQLDQERRQRTFVGQLDELAYYERALSSDEIRRHYRLVRPPALHDRGI